MVSVHVAYRCARAIEMKWVWDKENEEKSMRRRTWASDILRNSDKIVREPYYVYICRNETYNIPNFNITRSHNKPIFFLRSIQVDVYLLRPNSALCIIIKYSKRRTHKNNIRIETLVRKPTTQSNKRKRWKWKWKIIVKTSKLQQQKMCGARKKRRAEMNTPEKREEKTRNDSDKMVCHWL